MSAHPRHAACWSISVPSTPCGCAASKNYSSPGDRRHRGPSIHDWFRDKHNQKLLERLRPRDSFCQSEDRAASDKLAGTTWVITGTLSQPREEIADIIRANGGKVSGSVSAKTTYLLAGEEAGSNSTRPPSSASK